MKRTGLLALLRLMWHAHRPSAIADMPAVKNASWLRHGYQAMTFFGVIVTASQADAERMNAGMTALKRHELIHLRQAQTTGNSWLRFYFLYLCYYLRALPMNRHLRQAAYLLNPFEMEAYRHMYETDYLNQPATEWRQWAAMSPRQRLKAYQATGQAGSNNKKTENQ